MANSKAPQADFAPAWLKIPSENSKPSGSKQADQSEDKSSKSNRRNDYYYSGYPAYTPDYGYLQRQRSFEHYESPKYGSSKYRTHSVEDDYYGQPYQMYDFYNGYGYDKYGGQYNSQPSLHRQSPKENKYQHPHAYPSQMSSGYPSYYEPYSYDVYALGDPYFYSYARPPSRRSHQERGGDKDYKTNKNAGLKELSKEKEGKSEEKDKEEPNEEEPKDFNEEFPLLNGDGSEQSVSSKSDKAAGKGGVWDKSNPKIHTKPSFVPRAESKPAQTEMVSSKELVNKVQGANIYKALVPSKPIARRASKESLKLNGSFNVKEVPNNKPATPTTIIPPVVMGKNNNISKLPGGKEGTPARQSPTTPIEILNTRLVTQPKVLGHKKSDFLKTLKQESQNEDEENGNLRKGEKYDTEGSQETSNERELTDKIKKQNLKRDAFLSSSLEAEQRLLREMGWNEGDEEDYEITEDDLKAFQDLSKQIKQKPNGIHKTIPSQWADKKLQLFNNTAQLLKEEALSSSDDSESESD